MCSLHSQAQARSARALATRDRSHRHERLRPLDQPLFFMRCGMGRASLYIPARFFWLFSCLWRVGFSQPFTALFGLGLDRILLSLGVSAPLTHHLPCPRRSGLAIAGSIGAGSTRPADIKKAEVEVFIPGAAWRYPAAHRDEGEVAGRDRAGSMCARNMHTTAPPPPALLHRLHTLSPGLMSDGTITCSSAACPRCVGSPGPFPTSHLWNGRRASWKWRLSLGLSISGPGTDQALGDM